MVQSSLKNFGLGRLTASKSLFLTTFLTLFGIVGGWSVAILTQPIVSAEAFIKIGQVGTPVYDFGRERVVSELLENRSSLREIIYNKYRIHEARLKKLSLFCKLTHTCHTAYIKLEVRT